MTTKGRTYDADGIPSDAVKNTEEHIWIPERTRPGRVYKRRHGFKATYGAGCRCKRCKTADRRGHKRYLSESLKRGGTGRYPGSVIQSHIKWLADEKHVGQRELSRISGVSYMTVRRYKGGLTREVIGRNGDRIMAVTGDEDTSDRSLRGYVHPALSIQRLRSMAVLGYIPSVLYRMKYPDYKKANLYTKMIYHPETVKSVTVQTARDIRDLYQQIGDTPAKVPEDHSSKGRRTTLLKMAKDGAWLPPAGWDDPGTLSYDFPEEEEATERSVDWVVVERLAKGDRSEGFSHDERAEAVKLMMRQGRGFNDILLTLKLSSQTFRQLCQDYDIPHASVSSSSSSSPGIVRAA